MDNDILKEQIGLIAINIIKRAVKDYQGRDILKSCSYECKRNFKIEAKKWLQGSMCKFYCEMIGIDYLNILKKLNIGGQCNGMFK